MSSPNKIVVEVVAPNVAASDRGNFEAAAVEFLFGVDQPRPELHAELTKRGVNLNILASLSRETPLAICPDPVARQFVPSAPLARHLISNGVSLTTGGSVEVEFNYDQANAKTHAPDALKVHLRLPKAIAQTMTEELTGHLVTAVFGDCQPTVAARAYLNVLGVDLHEIAQSVGGAFASTASPPTTRVSASAAASLKSAGFDTDKFGKLEVMSVSALP